MSICKNAHAVAAQREFLSRCRPTGTGTFPKILAKALQNAVGAEGCSVYKYNETRRSLLLVGSTREDAPEGFEYPLDGKSQTTHAFKKTGVTLVNNLAEYRQLNGLEAGFPDCGSASQSLLAAPLSDAFGKKALARCTNKVRPERRPELPGGASKSFTELDRQATSELQELVSLLWEIDAEIAHRTRLSLTTVHEIRNPLQVLVPALEYARLCVSRIPDLEKISAIFDDMQHAVNIIATINNSTAVLFGDVSADENIDYIEVFGDVIASVVAMARTVAPARSVELTYGDIKSLPGFFAEINGIHLLLYNLTLNALKFAPRGSHVGIWGDVDRQERLLKIRFANQPGLEIRESEKDALFGWGYRGKNSRGTLGLGRGLFVAKRVVEAHKGSIHVTSYREPVEITVELPMSLCDMKWARNHIAYASEAERGAYDDWSV